MGKNVQKDTMAILNPIGAGLARKEEGKTKRAAAANASAEKIAASDAKKAEATAKTKRMEQDEDAIRKNVLLSTLKDRLSGTKTSNKRLS